jgi:hypothetical protein
MTTTPYVDPNTVHNPATGTSPPASWGDTVRSDLEFLARTPGCVVVKTATQTIPDDTGTDIEFSAADERDTDGYHSPSVNPDEIVVPTGLGGWYAIHAAVEFGASTVGRRQAIITVGGSDRIEARNAPTNAGVANVIVGGELLLAAGDVVRLNVAQTSGGDLGAVARMSVRLVAVS